MQGEFAATELTRAIIGCFFTTYNKLGAGFLESVYAAALQRELMRSGHHVQRELPVQVMYDGEPLAFQRLDFVVDRVVILELKAGPHLPPRATRQLHNYLRATNLSVGLLLHFGEKPRVHRVFVPHT
jgi:GxxExxY protein